MDFSSGVVALSALGQETRLSVFRLLVRESPNGLPAGVIAKLLKTNPSTMTGHLKILTQAKLLFPTRVEQQIVYRVEIREVRNLLHFLTKDCCDSNIDFYGDLESCLMLPE
jgi:ArsR family transcriptional regulator